MGMGMSKASCLGLVGKAFSHLPRVGLRVAKHMWSMWMLVVCAEKAHCSSFLQPTTDVQSLKTTPPQKLSYL